MLRTCLAELEPILDEPVVQQIQSLVSFGNTKRGAYIPLLQMLTCPSLEEKLESSAGKRRKIYEQEWLSIFEPPDSTSHCDKINSFIFKVLKCFNLILDPYHGIP